MTREVIWNRHEWKWSIQEGPPFYGYIFSCKPLSLTVQLHFNYSGCGFSIISGLICTQGDSFQIMSLLYLSLAKHQVLVYPSKKNRLQFLLPCINCIFCKKQMRWDKSCCKRFFPQLTDILHISVIFCIFHRLLVASLVSYNFTRISMQPRLNRNWI